VVKVCTRTVPICADAEVDRPRVTATQEGEWCGCCSGGDGKGCGDG
jgi:hypothetical protein